MQQMCSAKIQAKLRGYLACKQVYNVVVNQHQLLKILNEITLVLNQPKIGHTQKLQILSSSLPKILFKINCLLRIQNRLQNKNDSAFKLQLVNLLSIIGESKQSDSESGLQMLTGLLVQASFKDLELQNHLEATNLLYLTDDTCTSIHVPAKCMVKNSTLLTGVLLRKKEMTTDAISYLLANIDPINQSLPSNFVQVKLYQWLKDMQNCSDMKDTIFAQLNTTFTLIKGTQTVHSDYTQLNALNLATHLLTRLVNLARNQVQPLAKLMEIARAHVFCLKMSELSALSGSLEGRCGLVCDVMQLVQFQQKEAVVSQLEREVVYRSDFLLLLYDFLTTQDQQALETTCTEIVALFCSILKQRIIVIDDQEFLGRKQSLCSKFLTVQQLKTTCEMLNKIAYRVFSSEMHMSYFSAFFLDSLKSVLQRLVSRDMRLKLFPDKFWVVDPYLETTTSQMEFDKIAKLLSATILENCSQCYPFSVRAKVFTQMIKQTKADLGHGMYNSGIKLKIRRDFILEDALDAMKDNNFDVRSKFRIMFVDSQGQPEAGIDGGGLLKEFMTKLTEKIFDAQYSFFEETKHRQFFPNALSAKSNPEGFVQQFEFFGKVIGKALFEGVLLKCTFARFFLNKLVDKSNQVDDLQALDEQLYENLMKIKYYQGQDVEELGLTMTINEQHFGKIEELPLVQNGCEIPVTNENKLLYIVHYSNYMLNIKTKNQIAAFVRGLRKVIPAEGLSFFFPDEIQLLISGSSNEINIQDLKKYTVLNGWKPEEMPYIDQLWQLLESLPNETREKFVQFSTGTNRPPLLGFQYLTPHFCVAKQANVDGETRYPSSHTCANMFCLPFFGLDKASIEKMKKTVFEAINSSEQGFHMA